MERKLRRSSSGVAGSSAIAMTRLWNSSVLRSASSMSWASSAVTGGGTEGRERRTLPGDSLLRKRSERVASASAASVSGSCSPTSPARPVTSDPWSHSIVVGGSASSRSRRTTQTSWSLPLAPRPLAVPRSARSPTWLPNVARRRWRDAASPCPSAIGSVSVSPVRWNATAPFSRAINVTARPVPSERASASPSSVATMRCARASLLSRIERVPATAPIVAATAARSGFPPRTRRSFTSRNSRNSPSCRTVTASKYISKLPLQGQRPPNVRVVRSTSISTNGSSVAGSTRPRRRRAASLSPARAARRSSSVTREAKHSREPLSITVSTRRSSEPSRNRHTTSRRESEPSAVS